jgi:drug/metabolite transporter (DMT)-like permease
MAALILDLIVLLAGQSPLGYPPQTYLWFLLLALVPQLLGHSTYNWALGHLSATYVSIAVIAEPVGSTILAYFILKESPSALEIFGAILILAGIYLASHYE